MSDLELKMLQLLIVKLHKWRPDYTVLITDTPQCKVNDLVHHSLDFYCQLDTQIEIHFDDPLNTNLRDL